MTTVKASSVDYLTEWLHQGFDAVNGFERWQSAFDAARVAWQLPQAQRLLQTSKQVALSTRDRAMVCYAEGMLQAQLGDWQRSQDRLLRAIDLLEESFYVEEGIMILNDLGMILRLQGNHEGALAAHEQAVSLAAELDDPRLVAECWEQLGLDQEHQGEIAQAVAYFRRALAQYDAMGEQEERVRTLNHLGEAHWRIGELQDARANLEQAWGLSQMGYGDAYLIAQIEGNLGTVAYEEGDLAEAERRWQASLAAADALGVVFDKVGLLNNLGGLAFGREEYETAATYYLESLSLAEDLGDERGIQEAKHNLAVVYGYLRDAEEVGGVDHA